MNRTRGLIVAAIAIVLVTVAVWRAWPSQTSVILITIDTMRPDRISAYGYDGHITPNLDRLAREGTLFENAFCDVTWTTPSMASVMTGTYATRHGLRSSFHTLKPEALTLAEILKTHGRATAAIIASYPLHSIFGLNQGFDLYDETFNAALSINENVEFGPLPPAAPAEIPSSDDPTAMRWFLINKAEGDAYRPDKQVSDRAVAWLRAERRDPFFLWIHYFGPHEKPTGLTGLANIAQEQAMQIEAYDPDVRIVDQEIGRVLTTLDELGLTDSTAVLVHADHGQSLTEHDYFGHGRNVFDPTARIPMILRAPHRVPAGHRDARLARNVDILPTLLTLLRVSNPIDGDGIDLFSPGGGEARETYVETYLSGTWLFSDLVAENTRLGFRRLGLRTPAWKFVLNDPIQFVDRESEPLDESLRKRNFSAALYDLSADPGETRNVIAAHPEVAERLRQRVFDLQSLAPTKSQPMALDDETRDKLKALGYLGE